MARKGKSFSVDVGALDGIVRRIKGEEDRAQNLTKSKITQATNIMWRVARQKRPMMSKAQMRMERRSRRVSDPNAEAGVPVQTGALQNSIQKNVEVKRHSVIGRIWTSMPYAKYVEFGTSRMAARPFLRPAITLTRDAIKAMFEKQEKNA